MHWKGLEDNLENYSLKVLSSDMDPAEIRLVR